MFKTYICLCYKYLKNYAPLVIIILGVFFLECLPRERVNAYQAFLTLIIISIAWFQLEGIKKTAQCDFLLRIDNSFRSKEIQEAIYSIYLLDRESISSCSVHHVRDSLCPSCESAVTEGMKSELTRIWNSKEITDIKNRFNISMYLDHLETLSYYVNADYIALEDIDSLLGSILRYHRKLFSNWVDDVRKNDPEAYSELIKLCDKLPN